MQRQVVSLLVEHAPEAGLRSDFLESEPVMMHVLAPVRTLIEKLMIVHYAGSRGDVTEQERLARHYYDIWCLLSDHDTIAALQESPADVLAREVSTFTDAAGLEGTNRDRGRRQLLRSASGVGTVRLGELSPAAPSRHAHLPVVARR